MKDNYIVFKKFQMGQALENIGLVIEQIGNQNHYAAPFCRLGYSMENTSKIRLPPRPVILQGRQDYIQVRSFRAGRYMFYDPIGKQN